MSPPKAAKPAARKPRRQILIDIVWDSGGMMNGRMTVAKDDKGYWSMNDCVDDKPTGPHATLEDALAELAFSAASAEVTAPTLSQADLQKLLPVMAEDIEAD